MYDQPGFIRFAREGTAFYNAWFLDTQSGGVYFNVLANGQPYALGTERGKGSHSMAGYHSFKLCYLAATYINLLITKEHLDLYFRPQPRALPDNILRVAPDLLPPSSVRLAQVWINGHSYSEFDPEALTVKLPTDQTELKVRVQIVPVGVDFEAELLEMKDGIAYISLSGTLEPSGLKYFKEELEKAHGAQGVVFQAQDLRSISDQALRYLSFYK